MCQIVFKIFGISRTVSVKNFSIRNISISGFGGLGVSVLASGTQVRGSNQAEAVGFLRAEKSSARFPSEGK
jgi:hypothetical protein